MDIPSPYLSNAEYEACVKAGLREHGLTAAQCDALLALRWPMVASGVLSECEGRGLRLTMADLSDFLEAGLGGRCEPDSLSWPPQAVDALLCWAAASGRGRPTLASVVKARQPSLIEKARKRGGVQCS